jgi:MFS family permease
VMPFANLLFFDAGSFLVSCASLLLVHASFNSSTQSVERKHIGRDVVDGLRYVLGHPVLRNISLMMAMYNFVGTTISAQLVLFAKERLQASDAQVSLLYSAGSIGVVVLSLLAGVLRKRWTFSRVALGALMMEGMVTIIFAWTRLYWLALLLQALMMGLGILFNINTSSLRQTIVPDALLGRVMSIAAVLAWSAIPVGSILGGLAIGWTHNIALVYCAIGVIYFLIPCAFAFTALGHAEKYVPLSST